VETVLLIQQILDWLLMAEAQVEIIVQTLLELQVDRAAVTAVTH
jgi:hypothetical protein